MRDQSDGIDFGISMRLLKEVREEAQLAESLGFDYLLTGEHISFYGPTPNTLISLSAAAAVTERIKLLSGIVLVPLYPPALLAKLIATLDVISHGRYCFGIGIGGENPKEFAAVGVPVNERGARTNEALEVINRLLTEDKVSFEGKFSSFSDITIGPKSKERPPFWVSGRKEAAMRRAARYGDAWMPYMYSPEMLADSMSKIGAFTEKAGRPAGSVRGAAFAFTCVHEDGDTALKMANKAMSTTYNQDFTSLVGKYAIAGSPDMCRARVQEYLDAGARTVIFAHGCPAGYIEQNTRLLAEEVIPAFRPS
ncbi:MAG: LLM class flavin-dependent oxidoreductase [Acidimicrobiales bacterium]